MGKNKDELIEVLMQKISQLPPEGQSAMSFVIKNFHFIKKMCENTEMTDEEIQNRSAKAKENGDYFLLALLTAVQVFNEK